AFRRRVVLNIGGSIEDRQLADRLCVEPRYQNDGLIGKLQALDTGQPVGAIALKPASTKHLVSDGGHTVGVGHPRVIGRDLGAIGGVEVVGPVENLAHDLQLTGVVGAVEHERYHVGQAIEARDFSPGAVEIRAHANAHVEPLVAVDQIIAAASLQDVAAATAEDDVAGAEGSYPVAQEALQAVDERDIREDAAL